MGASLPKHSNHDASNPHNHAKDFEAKFDRLSYGHLSRRGDDGPQDVTLIAEFYDSALSLRYYGVQDAVLIEPDWVDIAISSPLLVAVAAIFPLFASVSIFLSDLIRRDPPQNAATLQKPAVPPWYLRQIIRRTSRSLSLHKTAADLKVDLVLLVANEDHQHALDNRHP